jgi:hypothetical protein
LQKWIQKQDFFEDDFIVRPACIHVIMEGQVRRVNLYTRKNERPDVKKVMKVHVVHDVTKYVVVGVDGSEDVEGGDSC